MMTARIRLKSWWIYGVAASGFLFFALAGVALAAAPNQPTNTEPMNGTAFYILTPTLKGSAFSDPDGDSHQETQWQVRPEGDTNPIWDYIDTDASKITEAVAAGKLNYARKYWWRMRYQDQTGAWSAFSAETYFTVALAPPQITSQPNAVTPISILWQWDNPAGNPTSGMEYWIFVKNSSGEFIYNGNSTTLTYLMTLAADGYPLDYETAYEIKVLANHDDYGQSSLSSPGFGTTEMQSCSNGGECRKGEVCYNYNTNLYKCARFNRCLQGGATCYLSVCDPGGANCYSSLSKRVFSQSPGICRGNICDLYATIANTPEICKFGGLNCAANTSAVNDVFVKPRFKWIDSDPKVEFNDYRSSLVTYAGDETRYQLELATAGVTTTYDWTHFANLDWLPDTERYLDFSQLIGGEQYLEYGTTYYWRVRSEARNPAPAKIVVSPVWQFTTTSLCSVLNFDYDPAQYLANQYAPNNIVTNREVIYPVNTQLEWTPDPDYTGSLSSATYELRVQECAADYSNCQAFTSQNNTSVTYRFGDGGHPYLTPGKAYRWQIFITRGANVTNCPIYEFKTGALPEIVLKKKLMSLREGEVTYKIDFSFNIPSNALRDENIFDFEVMDNFNTNIVNSITTDDVLVDAYPVGLRVATLTAGANFIKWQIVRPAGSSSSGATPPAAGPDPIAWWKMDEQSWNGTAGEVVDSSGNANHGTSFNGANTTAAGKYDRAGNFDGIDDIVKKTSFSPVPVGAFTISAWIKLNELGREQHFAEFTNTQFYVDPSNRLAVGGGGGQAPLGSSVLTSGAWYHAVWVYNSPGWKIYKDGAPDAVNASSAVSPGANFFIGDLFVDVGNYNFKGQIDDVRVYNQALSAAEIQNLYAPASSVLPLPVAQWKLDEGTGINTDDSAGSSDGTITGAVWKQAADCKFGKCLYFDGSDYVSVNNSTILDVADGPFSVSIWFKHTMTTGNARGILEIGGVSPAYSITTGYLDAGQDKLGFVVGGVWRYNIGSGFNDGNWHNFVAIQNGAVYTFYVDGVIKTGLNGGSASQTSTNNIGIGHYGYFVGTIDDVRVYNQALTPAQVTDVMNNTVNPTTPTTAATNSMSVFSRGSLILVAEEKPNLAACTFITNRAQAQGKTTGSSLFNVSALSNTVSHLAGSGNIDPGFLATRAGDIHSNASICLSKAPASGFYVADYFVTAKGSISKDTSFSRGGEKYIKEGWQKIDDTPGGPGFKDIDYETLYGAVDVVQTGECGVLSLFGATSGISLNGQIYRCQSGSSGADLNDDEITTNGDLVINDSMLINHNGGSGTVIVDGNLFINHDIKYTNTSSLTDVSRLASIGWIVRGDIFIKEYFIDAPGTCAKAPQKSWCDTYRLVSTVTPAVGAPYPVLAYGQLFVAPVEIVGVFFSEGTIYTGRAQIPLLVRGSLIADEIKLERLAFPQNN